MHPFARQGLLRRGGPFAMAALVVFTTVPLPPRADAGSSAAALMLTVAILACAVVVPWRRLPAGAAVVPPLLYFVVVALLRHAEGGSPSGGAILVALPVVWLALHGDRRQMLAGVAGAGLVLVAPLLAFGGPRYTGVEVEHGILTVSVMLLIGFTVQDLVGRVRHQAGALEELSRTDPLTGLGNR